MKQDRLNNCILMHCHKSIYGLTLDTVKIVKRFACADEQRKGHFGKFKQGYAHGWVKNVLPPPPDVSKLSSAAVYVFEEDLFYTISE